MPDMLNTHYNLIDSLVHLDRVNFNLALNLIISFNFKADMKLQTEMVYRECDTLLLSALIKEEWEKTSQPMKFHGPYAATLADAALWAHSQKYRHEPR